MEGVLPDVSGVWSQLADVETLKAPGKDPSEARRTKGRVEEF